jgi:tetratricopeptide (TPR) repeat protein
MALAQEVVQRYAGTITHSTGEDFTALFGVPVAQEDHARRAVLTALELHQRLHMPAVLHTHVPGGRFTVRMGIHSGLVVAGNLGLEPYRLYAAVGAPTHLAMRLQQHAAPGTILMSAATHELVHGEMQSETCGALDVEGTPTPVPVYTVRGLRQRRAGVTGYGARVLSRFVGREQELALLHACLAQVTQGQGQAVGIAGDPGLGKSRLLYEFQQSLQRQPVTYYQGHCLPYSQRTPYLPIRDLVRHYCSISETDAPDAITLKVHQCLQEAGLVAEEATPLLLELLDVPVTTAALSQLSPPVRKARTFSVLHHLSRYISERQGLVLVVENLHWIDATSEEWLATLVERLAGTPILVLVTYRPGYRPSWLGQSVATQVALPHLTPQDSLTMVRSVLPTVSLPERMRQEIVLKAAGNPFFLEELTWTVREYGISPTPLTLPTTIQAVIAARLDRLPAAEKALLQTAAVIGTEVPLPLLQAVSGLEEDVLQQRLRRLQTDEHVYETRLVPVPVHTFKHVLTQEVAYNSLLRGRRTELHMAIGCAMETLYQERLAERYTELAHHFTQGEAWERAFWYLVKAGDKARQNYANQDAITFYTRALEVSARITPVLDAEQLLPVYEGRGAVWMILTKYDEAIADFQEMRQIARTAGKAHKEGESLGHLAFAHWGKFSEDHIPFVEQYAREAMQLFQHTGDYKILARSLTSLAFVHQVRGNLQEGDQLYEESLRISRREGYQDSIAQNLLWLGAQAHWQGHFPRAIQLGREGLAIAHAISDGVSELFNLAFLCLASWSAGDCVSALEVLHAGITKAKERGNMFILGRLLNTLGWFHSECGAVARAMEYDQESLELGCTHRIANVEISALINLGLDYLALGQHARAQSYLESTLERVQREAFGVHRWRWKIRLLIGLAELYYTTGAYEQAQRTVDEGLQEAQATSSQKYVAKGWALRGKILTRLGQIEVAGHDLKRAYALAERLSSPSLHYPIAYDLGQWYERAGQEQQAATLYTTAKASITHLMTAVEDETLCEAFQRSGLVQALWTCAARLGV